MKRLVPFALLILPLAACSGSSTDSADPEQVNGETGSGTPIADPLAFMRTAIDELMAKPEHGAAEIDVQHILVTFREVEGMERKGITRSKEDAEMEAAKLYARLMQGEDFKTLLEAHTDDSEGLPVYNIVGRNARFVEGFKKVGWRLEVGEIGVSPWHAEDSHFGWHIIQRVK